MNVYVLYRDIRTYGEREYLYKEARENGVIFIRFSVDDKPQVAVDNGRLTVRVKDHILGRPLELETDLITLATAIIPNRDEKLANFFKVPLNADGFFVERHAKLGPSEFATDGVFLCGMAHYPKPIDESIVQGKAAASRAVTLLAREIIQTSGTIAEVVPTIVQFLRGVRFDLSVFRAVVYRGNRPLQPGQGPDQSRALQGMRALRGFLQIRGHPSEGL